MDLDNVRAQLSDMMRKFIMKWARMPIRINFSRTVYLKLQQAGMTQYGGIPIYWSSRIEDDSQVYFMAHV